MLLDDIADYLSSGGHGTVGTDLFRGLLPPDPDTCTAIYETGGLGTVHAMGNTAGQAFVERPRVQVLCRGPKGDYTTARARAHAVFKLLDGMPARTINGTDYMWGAAVQSPFLFNRDEAGRVIIACNFDIVKRLSA